MKPWLTAVIFSVALLLFVLCAPVIGESPAVRMVK